MVFIYSSQTLVYVSHGLISTSEGYFEEPDKFIPERWSKDKESIHPFASLPFGFGQRGCYGKYLNCRTVTSTIHCFCYMQDVV